MAKGKREENAHAELCCWKFLSKKCKKFKAGAGAHVDHSALESLSRGGGRCTLFARVGKTKAWTVSK